MFEYMYMVICMYVIGAYNPKAVSKFTNHFHFVVNFLYNNILEIIDGLRGTFFQRNFTC